MANAFSRSWEITKLCFNVMKADKELFLFPIVGFIFSVMFIIALVFPTVFMYGFADPNFGPMFYLILLFIYFGLAFIAIFFNVCTVYTIKTRFEGKNATFWDSIRFSFSKIHLVFQWALLSAIVGIILRILENMAKKAGGIGGLIMKLLVSLLGAAWSIVTLFVVPGMVYQGVGPIGAIKKSAEALKKTWGESLIRYLGMGLAQFILFLVGIVFTIGLALFAYFTLGLPMLMWIFIGLGILYLVAVGLFFTIMNTIFNTALFVYADTGKVPAGFSKETLAGAFGSSKKEKI